MFLMALLMVAASGVALAQNYTISGVIVDKDGGETMIGATVYDAVSGKGVSTNAYGRFSLTLPKGNVNIRFAYPGFQPKYDSFMLDRDTSFTIALNSVATQLQAVVVQAERPTDAKSSQMSAVSIPVEHLKAVPVLFGEADVLKAIQLMPGVQSGSEGTSGMYVRGGGPDENLFLLDGVPLYNVNHLGGFFSAFNSDAIKGITLYKGSFPAHFGGRLSSVLDITQNDGNNRELHGGVSVGAIATKFYVEGPIIKEKTTFSVSARRTYADALLQPFVRATGIVTDAKTTAGYYFYDFNAKVAHKFSDKSRLYFTYYLGDDKVYAKYRTRNSIWGDNSDVIYMGMKYNWGNMVAAARWNYVLTPKLFMNVSGAYTRYRNNMSLSFEEAYSYGDNINETNLEMSYNSGIRDITGRVDFDYAPNPDNTIKFGTYMIHHIFSPEVLGTKVDIYQQTGIQEQQFLFDSLLGESVIHANEANLYFEDDWNITATIKVNGGVNASVFGVQGKAYPSIQPRLSGRLLLSDDLSFKVGYSYTTQYLHLLSNSTVSLPTDLWVPVTARIVPMNAHQVAAGFFYNWGVICDLSVEGYFKKMNNLMEYKDGASFWGSSTGWEDKVTLGQGWAYGIEFLAQRTVGQFTGWLGYTWSHANRQFDDISQGQVFPAKYDRRHDLSIVLMYKPNENFDASVSWVFCSGNTATLALQEYEPLSDGGEYDDYGYYYDNSISYYETRNNYRLPAYHRMDVSVNFHKQKKHGKRTVNIGVYNLYNRKNPYVIYESEGLPYTSPTGQHYGSSLMQISLFPIIPSVSYQFKF